MSGMPSRPAVPGGRPGRGNRAARVPGVGRNFFTSNRIACWNRAAAMRNGFESVSETIAVNSQELSGVRSVWGETALRGRAPEGRMVGRSVFGFPS